MKLNLVLMVTNKNTQHKNATKMMETVKKWNTLWKQSRMNGRNAEMYNFLPWQSQVRKTSLGDWQTAKWCQKGTLFQDFAGEEKAVKYWGSKWKEGWGYILGEGRVEHNSKAIYYLFMHLTLLGHASPRTHWSSNRKKAKNWAVVVARLLLREDLLLMIEMWRWECGWVDNAM